MAAVLGLITTYPVASDRIFVPTATTSKAVRLGSRRLARTRLEHTLYAILGISTTRKVTVAMAHTLVSPARVEDTETDTTHKVLPV